MRYGKQDIQIARAMLTQWWRSQTAFDKVVTVQAWIITIGILAFIVDCFHPFAPWLKSFVFITPMIFIMFNAVFGPLLQKEKPEESIEAPLNHRTKREKPKLYIVPKEPDQSA